VQNVYLGIKIRDGVLSFEPKLIDRLDGLTFWMQFHRSPLQVTLESGELTVAAHSEGFGQPVTLRIGEEVRELSAGESCSFSVRGAPSATGARSTSGEKR
jgi:trehalose/maltose hydrolase-like predicted phosphorylase